MKTTFKDFVKWARVRTVEARNPRLFERFMRAHGYSLNMMDPTTFNEKIQWIKFFGRLERFANYVDKYAVRKFVEERCGRQFLVPLIGVYENANDIDLWSLPNSCAIKATHGSKWNVIVKDKSKLDWDSAKEKLNGWVGSNYFERTGEPNYKPLRGRIIIEEYLGDQNDGLHEYDFYCYKGEPRYVLMTTDKPTVPKVDFFDISWKKLEAQYHGYENSPGQIHKPEKLDEMIEIARKLSMDFPYVRVDLYEKKGRIYFSELTFTPQNGIVRIIPVDIDLLLGEPIDLNAYLLP